MKIRMQEVRAAVESSLRAARNAKSESTRELLTKRARLLEAIADGAAWLDADARPSPRLPATESDQAPSAPV